jgi:DNA helicase II / ATP-dependent DNA helicase PcrA
VANQKKGLNLAQRQAVNYLSGPLLIVAGAGTGKTTVITEKVKNLVVGKYAKPEEILALTFTDKAAEEMETRVDVALPLGYTDTWIMTFHSFCDRILKDEGIQIGQDPGFKLMSQSEAIQFLTDHLFDFGLKYFRPLGNPSKFVMGLLNHFSRLRDEDVTPKQYLSWAKQFKVKSSRPQRLSAAMAGAAKLKEKEAEIESEKYLELAKAYQTYEELKRQEGLFDFGDLIAKTLDLFRKRPNVLASYQERFKFFLVDEFQDTNIAQYQLIKMLAPVAKNPNLSVVADDSQSIYRFRGAAVSNVLQFIADYPSAKSIVLIKNYRSTQRILDRAYQLIQYNNPDTLEVKLGIDKNLRSVNGLGDKVRFIYGQKVDDEAEQAAKIIKREKQENGVLNWSDFAILVRANNQARPFARALSWFGIPYQFLGTGMLFRQEEIKNLIAYLAVLANLHDDTSYYRLLNCPPFDLSGRDLVELSAMAKKVDLSLFEVSEAVLGQGRRRKIGKELLPLLSSEGQEKLSRLLAIISRHLEMAKRETAGQILYDYLDKSGLLKEMTRADSSLEERKIRNIARFFDRLSSYEADHDDASVGAVVAWLKLSLELGESPTIESDDWFPEDRVNILTVHSAKGLEFEVVFLVNLVAGRFPTYNRREQIPIPGDFIREILPQGDYHQQEERRLFYVGMTRAKKKLFLSAAKFYGEGKRAKKISPFVYQALGRDLIDDRPMRVDQLPLLKFKPVEKEKALPVVRSQASIDRFSFSQLASFERCPAQYCYQYLKRIPVAPSGAQNFGIAIHQALYQFYQRAKKGRVSQKTLLSLYRKNWLPFGYSSRFYEGQLFEEGEKMLKRFYRQEFNPQSLPYFLEKKFNFFLTDKIKIAGVFDRVDKKNKAWEIVDYKTGQAMKTGEADKSLQMTIYLLAATDPGVLNASPDKLVGVFYFLKEGEKVSVTKKRSELARARKKLIAAVRSINQSDFAPRPGFWCDFCPFKMVCDAWG